MVEPLLFAIVTMETDNQWKMDSFLEEERLKSTMTIPKAISLLKDKHAVRLFIFTENI